MSGKQPFSHHDTIAHACSHTYVRAWEGVGGNYPSSIQQHTSWHLAHQATVWHTEADIVHSFIVSLWLSRVCQKWDHIEECNRTGAVARPHTHAFVQPHEGFRWEMPTRGILTFEGRFFVSTLWGEEVNRLVEYRAVCLYMTGGGGVVHCNIPVFNWQSYPQILSSLCQLVILVLIISYKVLVILTTCQHHLHDHKMYQTSWWIICVNIIYYSFMVQLYLYNLTDFEMSYQTY